MLRVGKVDQYNSSLSSVACVEALPSPTLLARNHELSSRFVRRSSYNSVLCYTIAVNLFEPDSKRRLLILRCFFLAC